MNKYTVAIDQGTTGSTVLVIRCNADSVGIIGLATQTFPQHFPQANWVEHKLNEIWQSVVSAGNKALEQAQAEDPEFHPHKLAAIGITNQRETLCLYPRNGGISAYPAIVWQCKRSLSICEELKRLNLEMSVRQKTGLLGDPYFTASKLRWAIENWDGVKNGLANGSLLASTIDSFLLFKLTQGASFATEASNASRTMLFNIETNAWDSELADWFKVPTTSCLPQIQDSINTFGVTKGVPFLPDGVPIMAMLGDQQSALAGQGGFSTGDAKCTYGTGAFLLHNTGELRPKTSEGLLTTVAWRLNGRLTYALEGSVFIAGAAVQFLRDHLHLFASSSDTEALASSVKAAPELYFVPALAGLGAPWWLPEARGTIFGLTRATSSAQLVRATLEGIAFSVDDLVQTMQASTGIAPHTLRVDGGASANAILLQLQANYSQLQVQRPKIIETTGLGTGLFAAMGAGIYSNLEHVSRLIQVNAQFQPQKSSSLAAEKMGWVKAVRLVREYYKS